MIWRCTVLLALCAFSYVRSMAYSQIEVRYGGGPGYHCTPECYSMIRQWFMQQSCVMPYMGGNGYYPGGSSGTGGSGYPPYYPSSTYPPYPPYYPTTDNPYGQDVYIDYRNNYGQIESLKVSGPCFAHQLCDKCGPNGQCVVEAYNQPECKCKEGFEGDKCDEEVPEGQNNVIIAVTVIAGLLAFFILVAVIVHICWKHRGNDQWKKPNRVQVVKNPGCSAGNHCGPVSCSRGHPALKASCNMHPAPLRIHAATPMHGMPGMGQCCSPPVVFGGPYPPMGPCCPPKSTCKITEIVEDPPYAQSGAVVPAGLFGGGQPASHNVYTTIGAAPAGSGTVITLG